MPGYHMNRLTEDIHRELTDILRGLKDPRITGLVSVARVEVSSDLSYAKVHVSSIGGDAVETAKGLNSASGFVRHELSARLHVRKTPEIKFIADHSIEQSIHISKLIDDVSKD